MKKGVLLAALIVALCMSGCGKTYDDGYAEGYDIGYDDGYIEGRTDSDLEWFDYADDMYHEGYRDCADAIEDWWEDIDDYYIGNHGYTMSEALQILDDYVNGVPVEKETVEDALWILHIFPKDIDGIVSEISFY